MDIRTLEPGTGENFTRDGRKQTTILVDSDEVVAVLFGYAPGEEGPDPHIHRHHTDSFFVLEGEFEIRVADSVVRATPGTWVSAPPGVVHTFANRSAHPARLINLHTPGMGFAAYLRALRAGESPPDFDQEDPPPDGGLPAPEGAVVRLP